MSTGAIIAVGALGVMVCCSSSVAAVMMGGDDDKGPSPGPGPSPSPSSQKEVFYIKGSEGSAYTFSKDAAKAACVAAGATLATSAQLTSDHTAGADWCATGWLNDQDPSYPITTSLREGCSTTAKVVTWKPPGDLAGATCYGVKPAKDANPLVLPFNASKWSRYA